jgi:hypothetical protein
MNDSMFDPIRPYEDHEVKVVLEEMLAEKDFLNALQFIFPDTDINSLTGKLSEIDSVNDFQARIIAGAVKRIVALSVSGLQSIGIEVLKQNGPFLVISNHRDIVLDSALLNYVLFVNGIATTRIAIGNNLLQKSWIEKLVRLNKNFIIHRDVQARQAYEYAARVSAYIRKSIIHDQQSVWIAQREGRTKDGNDMTQPGLLKMLGLSAENEGFGAYTSLNILPLSISYELEPFAGLKAREMYVRHTRGTYTKAPGEDLVSMRTGILQPKGQVTLHFGKPLNPEAVQACFEGKNRNDALRELALLIDYQIKKNLKPGPFHFYAADRLSGKSDYQAQYTEQTIKAFDAYLENELSAWPEKNEIMPFLIQIYANQVGSEQVG